MPFRQNPRSQLLQSASGVFDKQQFVRQIAKLAGKRQPLVNHHRGASSIVKDLADKLMTVNSFTGQGNKQITGFNRARINRKASWLQLSQAFIQHLTGGAFPRNLA